MFVLIYINRVIIRSPYIIYAREMTPYTEPPEKETTFTLIFHRNRSMKLLTGQKETMNPGIRPQIRTFATQNEKDGGVKAQLSQPNTHAFVTFDLSQQISRLKSTDLTT